MRRVVIKRPITTITFPGGRKGSNFPVNQFCVVLFVTSCQLLFPQSTSPAPSTKIFTVAVGPIASWPLRKRPVVDADDDLLARESVRARHFVQTTNQTTRAAGVHLRFVRVRNRCTVVPLRRNSATRRRGETAYIASLQQGVSSRPLFP